MSSPLVVHHLNCAVVRGMKIDGAHFVCHTLLVETPSSGLVLVDTGLGALDYENIGSRLGWEFAYGWGRPLVDPALAAVHQIKALGLDPGDVRHIVLTHMDLDHIGGLADFPAAQVHLHRRELDAATARDGFVARRRYRPSLWDHGPRFETYADTGERWFGFEAVRHLKGLPEEILFVPLFGHTHGHSGVAVQSADGWLLHAGDAYFDPRQIKAARPYVPKKVAAFEAFVTTNRQQRVWNQTRLRELARTHPEIDIFCAHNPHEFPGDPRPGKARTSTLTP
ncbi:MBL fold metallo-hydrolase [Streptomyces sp. NPDC091281]|uniref:MBL fold metallo-hydrolase n=1 Tax=Streptomyces sp. NPDC091281 TaxID=3365985 RepID=UPI0037FA9D9F